MLLSVLLLTLLNSDLLAQAPTDGLTSEERWSFTDPFRSPGSLAYTSGAKAIDNGTRREMFTFPADLIIRF
jgi:hypothetical protein